jgi:hypothetical protein
VDDVPVADPTRIGVAGELHDAWLAEHGEASPSEMVEQYKALIGR